MQIGMTNYYIENGQRNDYFVWSLDYDQNCDSQAIFNTKEEVVEYMANIFKFLTKEYFARSIRTIK